MLISFPQDIKIEEKEGSLIGFHLSASVWLCRSFFHSFHRFSSSLLMPEFRPGVAVSRCPGWARQRAGVWEGGGCMLARLRSGVPWGLGAPQHQRSSWHGGPSGAGTRLCPGSQPGQRPADPCTSPTAGRVTKHRQFSEKETSNNINFLLEQTVR